MTLLVVAILLARDPSPAEFSNYRSVGTMHLPHRLQLQAGSVREDWTIERIEIVPLP